MLMRFRIQTKSLAVFLSAIISMFLFGFRDVFAAGEPPPGPDRFIAVEEKFMQYTWWLVGWTDNKAACQIEIDHDGLPTHGEIYSGCGSDVYKSWIATEECEADGTDPGNCQGYYLFLYKENMASRIVAEELPPPVVWITHDECIPYASTYKCAESPILVLTGEEPLSEYSIQRLEGTIDGEPFICAPTCQIHLTPTEVEGIMLRFWAYSNYGDSSEIFTARVRVRSTNDPSDTSYFLDVISTQWRGGVEAPCMKIWNTFPPVGGLDNWLATPESPDELATDIPYEYLAGRLISNNVVDASSCSDLGLLDNGYASVCGMEIARSAVIEWQNQFDALILMSAQEVGIPAQLLKNIFSRESQFWPGVVMEYPEAGLGQLTLDGADTTLLWNQPFYEQFCAQELPDSICAKGYSHITDQQRTSLQAALVARVDAFCAECALGIDIDIAEQSVMIFAETLLANCGQSGMVIDLNDLSTNYKPTYEDLWRFTLVNYNAGSGCLGLAINKTSSIGEPLDWEHVSLHLTSVCQGAIDYVNDITAVYP